MPRVDEEYDGENSFLINVPLDSQIEYVEVWVGEFCVCGFVYL